MGHSSHCIVCIFLSLASFTACNSYQFIVGGHDGWTPRPTESYGNWAQRLRFQVNDTLHFDSVAVVTQKDYSHCDAASPLQKLDDANSLFKFDRSGPFFFITGNKSNCAQGQKLIIVVLAIRSPPPAPPSGGSGASPSPADAPAPSLESGPGGSDGPPGSSNGGGPPHHRSFASAARAPVVLVTTVAIFSLGFGGFH